MLPCFQNFDFRTGVLTHTAPQPHCAAAVPAASGVMDMFNLGNLTACCTCSRKADIKTGGEDANGFAQRSGEGQRGRLDKPQLGGVGIVFQGTDDGGLKVRACPACPCCRRSLACAARVTAPCRRPGKLHHVKRAGCGERTRGPGRPLGVGQWRLHRWHD